MQTYKVPEYSADERKTIVREHCALFPTRIALARWASGADQPHANHNKSLSPRTTWYKQAQRNFQSWLDQGGFTQYDELQHPPTPAPDGHPRSEDVCLD